ncbi:L,D-transpeptidase [Chelatococcus sambhunathii]|uniref:L,D-transpeptidase n=1 Tax=Chelatococcus sambhunathii TaxID=363953 RepID=A0ABU1DIS3_9HYPH|nr:L,D-transpeptidase [Chelatococcus sambhunathii]MDR4308036.1 L,D-transpeptidase [Chelatococcus sambhunathii]
MARTFSSLLLSGAVGAAALLGAVTAAEAGRAPAVDPSGYGADTIVVSNSERALYYVRGWGRGVIRYRVAVGKPGRAWLGTARIRGKYVQPAWSPPADVKRDHPHLPNVIVGGVKSNPMGARALLLDRDQYAIHGTNRPKSIGTYASYGCIRMRNEDIVELYKEVSVGTRVVVVP